MLRLNGRREFAVIGLGRFGTSVALELTARGFIVLGIDQDREIVQRLADDLTRAIALDSTNEDALRDVDIASFDTVVVAIGTDFESNLLTTVTLKSLGVRNVICKATTEQHKTILLKVGADRVVLPEHEAGRRLARTLAEPNVLDHLDIGREYSLVELLVPSSFVGATLFDMQIRRLYSITVLAIKRGATLTVSPSADYVFEKGDVLVVIGAPDHIARFCEIT